VQRPVIRQIGCPPVRRLAAALTIVQSRSPGLLVKAG
jgi:hypothetical protein